MADILQDGGKHSINSLTSLEIQHRVVNSIIVLIVVYYVWTFAIPMLKDWKFLKNEKARALARIEANSVRLAEEALEIEERLIEIERKEEEKRRSAANHKSAAQIPIAKQILKPSVLAAPQRVRSAAPAPAVAPLHIRKALVSPQAAAPGPTSAPASVHVRTPVRNPVPARSQTQENPWRNISPAPAAFAVGSGAHKESPADEFRRLLRAQQDEEYASSVARDRLFVEEKKKTQDHMQALSEEQRSLEAQRLHLRASVAPEPSIDHASDEVINIQFRVSGFDAIDATQVIKINRRFMLNQTTDAVIAFITSHDVIPLTKMKNVAIMTTTVVVGSSPSLQPGFGLRAFSSGKVVLLVRLIE